MREPTRGLLIVRHWILVDGKSIYEGEDGDQAALLFRDCVETPAIGRVTYEVQKRIVPVSAPPGLVGWEQGTPV